MKGFRIDTPLEKYNIKGKDVFVKREDLMGDNTFLPRWGKILAIKNYIEKNIDINKPLTTLSVDGSWSGWVVSSICNDLGIEHLYSFPNSKKFNKKILDNVVSFYPKIKLNPIKPNMVSIMYNGLKGKCKKNGTQIVPYGFEHEDFISVFEDRIKEYNQFDNLIVSSGSGISLIGLTRGFLLRKSQRVISVCVSSENTINKRLKKYGIDGVEVYKSKYDFSNRMEDYNTPFPTNQFWDRKGWKWLEENIKPIEGSILFWNLGGEYEY